MFSVSEGESAVVVVLSWFQYRSQREWLVVEGLGRGECEREQWERVGSRGNLDQGVLEHKLGSRGG